MSYPSVLSTLSNPNATDRLNAPSHSSLHQSENTAIIETQTFVGTLSSTQGSLVYDIRSPNSNGGGHVQTANTGGTGQTAYTKGDLLVAQSQSVLAKLAAPGTDNLVLTSDSSQIAGVKWGTGPVPTVRIYQPSVTSATGQSSLIAMWFKPSTLSYVVVEVIGPGGGGSGNNNSSGGGAGGGGGGYARKNILAASLPLAASIIAGMGGAGGAAGIGGSVSGTTYLGSILTATGGAGGATTGVGGLPGAGTNGDINTSGGRGGSAASATPLIPGLGGLTFYTSIGKGGDGARGNTVGNDGNNGMIVITEY